MNRNKKKILIALGQLIVYVLAYTILFQLMFCWIKYDNPLSPWGLDSFIYSIPFNYIPMFIIAGVALFTCWKTIPIDNLWKKLSIDAAALIVAVVIVNLGFPIITGLPVSWGGTIFNGIMIGIIVELWSVSQQKQEAIYRQSMMEKEIIERKYDVIKSYVNPHFLYNTLDMLCTLIEEKNHTASLDFALSLSNYYRNLTNLMNIKKSSLENELAIVSDYMKVIKPHYGDAINFRITGQDNGDISVIPFSIQLLVENALKHNIINEKNPMDIQLKISDDSLTLSNTCKRKMKTTSRRDTGLGLKYLKTLYGYHGKQVEITDTPELFSVSLPKAI